MKEAIYHRRKAVALENIERGLKSGILARTRDKMTAEVELLEATALALAGERPTTAVDVAEVCAVIEKVNGVGPALAEKIEAALREEFG